MTHARLMPRAPTNPRGHASEPATVEPVSNTELAQRTAKRAQEQAAERRAEEAFRASWHRAVAWVLYIAGCIALAYLVGVGLSHWVAVR